MPIESPPDREEVPESSDQSTDHYPPAILALLADISQRASQARRAGTGPFSRSAETPALARLSVEIYGPYGSEE